MLRLALLLIFLAGIPINGRSQVFNTPTAPPPPPSSAPTTTSTSVPDYLLQIDTSMQEWSLDAVTTLGPHDHRLRFEHFKKQSFGRLHKNGETLAFAAVHTTYKDGYSNGSELRFKLLDLKGQILDSLSIPHQKGISLVGLTSDGSSYYVAYQREISSGDRTMHVAKISQEAELVWETLIGQRFGTRGLNLLRVSPDGNVVLFAQMYDQIGFDQINTEGKIIGRKLLYFEEDFSPRSFFFEEDGSLVGIGSYTEYEGSETYSSSVVFRLNASYQLLHYKQLQSPYQDEAQDVISTEAGQYAVLTNATNLSAPYGERQNFMTISILNQELDLVHQTNIKNTATGLSLGLHFDPQAGLFTYQRVYNRRPSFLLYQLLPDLSIKQMYSARTEAGLEIGDPTKLIKQDGKFYLLCGDLSSTLVSFSLPQKD